MIKEEDIQNIRRQADIADIISHYIDVQKNGRNYKAVCPFHDDHDPSLSISREKQIYKCFVCGSGGNVFTFVQKYENVSFTEA
ncbi:CHC2 zinc finger domain-containing protein, partial [Dubosiella newyorkensis]